MKLPMICIAVLTLAFGIASDADAEAQGVILWASTGGSNASGGGGRVYKIDPDPESRTVTLVGDTELDRLAALDFDNDGNLYGLTGGSSFTSNKFTLNLYTLSMDDASVTEFIGKVALIGNDADNFVGFQGIDAIAFDSSGTLFATGYSGIEMFDPYGLGRLLILDPATASASLVNPISMGTDIDGDGFADSITAGEAGLAFDAAGQLFGSRGNAIDREADLVRIDTLTEARTALGSKTNVISDIWFAADGTLYGASPHGENGEKGQGALFKINPEDGTKEFLFNTGIRISGLTGQDPVVEVPEVVVDIDIKPWRFPNKIFPWYGLVSVAIFGSADFDVDDRIYGVDTTTLGFGPAGGAAFRWVLRGYDFSQPHDGYNDLIVFFRASRSGIKCGDTEAPVTGSTNSGDPIVFGTDSIVTVGCFKWRPPSRHRHRHRDDDDDDDDDDD